MKGQIEKETSDLTPSLSGADSLDHVASHSSQLAVARDTGESTETAQQREHCVESPGSEEEDVRQKIEALDRPCHIQFSCTAAVSLSPTSHQQSKDGGPSPPKKARVTEERDPTTERYILFSFQWIRGNTRESLHQIVQYLKNTTFQY